MCVLIACAMTANELWLCHKICFIEGWNKKINRNVVIITETANVFHGGEQNEDHSVAKAESAPKKHEARSLLLSFF